MKNKKIWVGLVVLLAICLVVTGIFLYKKETSSENIFKKTVTEVFKKLKSNLKESDTAKLDYKFKANIEMDDNEYKEIIDMINKFEIGGKYAIDLKNNKMDLVINTKYNNKTMLDAEMYVENNTIYALLDGIYDKYIKISDEDLDLNFDQSFDKKDLEQIYVSLEKAINSSFKEEYFTYEKEDGFDKTTLKLDNKNAYEIVKNVSEILSKDEKFLDAISKISETKKEDIVDSLKGIDESDFEDDNQEEVYYISVYTKGLDKEFKKLVLTDKTNEVKIEEKENDSYELTINVAGEEIANITYKEKDDNYTISVKAEGIKVTLDMYLDVDDDYKFENKDISNNVKVEEISEDDLMDILTKIQKNEGLIELINVISSFSGLSIM